MLRKVLGLTLATAWSLLAAAPVAADVGGGNGEFGVDVGVTLFDSNTIDDVGLRSGLRLGYHFTDRLQLEAQWGVQEADNNSSDVTLTTLMANVVINFHPRPKVVHYVLVGGGRANLEAKVFRFRVDDDSTAAQAAVGSRYFPGGGGIGVRAEASALWEETFEQGSVHIGIAVGVTWRLGASR